MDERMDEKVVKLLERMEKRPSASKEALARLHRYVAADLPMDYVGFLRWTNGAEGQVRPYLPLIAEKLAWEPTHCLFFSVEEVLEYTESTKDYGRQWRETWPGYLAISFIAGYIGLIDTRSRDPEGMTYAFGDPHERTLLCRLSSFAELVECSSTVLVDLTKADLRGADLRGVRLLHPILHYVSFVGADLTGADLRNAALEGADFTQAKLSNICLTGAFYDEDTRWPEGFDPRQHGASLPWEEGTE
jgi:hypothetical protein